MILFQETKLGSMDRGVLRVCPYDFPNRVCLPSIGKFGGTWIVWDAAKVVVLES